MSAGAPDDPLPLLRLLLQVAAVLVLSRLLGRVLRRVGQPAVVAEILAGIALGPSLLGVVAPGAVAWLFPPASLPPLGLVADLGLVLFMFLVGLELDPRLLRTRAGASFAISAAGIAVPFAAGAGFAALTHRSLAEPGVEPAAFAVFLGAAMSVTAFPVLARILTERRLLGTEVGATALSAAAVGDVLAWCLLAVVVGMSGAGGPAAALRTLLLTVGFVVVVWVAVRPVLARLGPRRGQDVSTEVVSAVIVVLVLSAATTEAIGVHALFGGFLVGAALPRDQGVAAALVEKLEDVVGVVLLPLFFAYSGLRTKITLLDDAGAWALCGAIIVVATVGKLLGTALAARLVGLGRRDAWTVGTLMNTRGLMEIVILNVGLELGVIGERLFAMMVVMALVTTWITTPIVARLQPAVRALAEETGARAAGGAAVLLCVADPDAAPHLVQVARALVRGEPGKVWALHLRRADRPHDYLRAAPDPSDTPLDAVVVAARRAGLRHESLSLASASPAEDIARIATLLGRPLVLMGAHRGALGGGDPLGGVVADLLRHYDGEVGVLLDAGPADLRRVAVPSEPAGARPAFAFANRLARGGVVLAAPPAPGGLGGVDLLVVDELAPLETPGPRAPRLYVRAARAPSTRPATEAAPA